MGIETILTLVVAAGLLLFAVALRWVAVTLFRLGTLAWRRFGPAAPPRRARLDDALPGPSFGERAGGALQGAGALMIYLIATVARALRPVGEALRVAVRAAWYALIAAYAWIAPRVEAALENVRFVPQAPVPLLADRSVTTASITAGKLAGAKSKLGKHAGAA